MGIFFSTGCTVGSGQTGRVKFGFKINKVYKTKRKTKTHACFFFFFYTTQAIGVGGVSGVC